GDVVVPRIVQVGIAVTVDRDRDAALARLQRAQIPRRIVVVVKVDYAHSGLLLTGFWLKAFGSGLSQRPSHLPRRGSLTSVERELRLCVPWHDIQRRNRRTRRTKPVFSAGSATSALIVGPRRFQIQ